MTTDEASTLGDTDETALDLTDQDAEIQIHPSPSLAAAQSAETFFAGTDSGDEPSPTPAAQVGSEPPPGGFFGTSKDMIRRVMGRVKEHNLNVVAAGVAFWGLLAIPAILTATISIYGLVADPEDVEAQIEDALSGASEEVQEIIGDQMISVAGASGGGLALGAIVGILLALWTSSGAIAKVMATLNVIWGAPEDRKFLKLRGLAVTLTIGAIFVVLSAAFLFAALPAVLAEAGLGDQSRWALNISRFPIMLILMVLGLSLLYWTGPNTKRPFRVVTWGAAWATVLWLLMSGLFSVYTASFATYNETYGGLGAVVILLLWLFLTAFTVLLGAEIDAAREERSVELERFAASQPVSD